MMSTIADGWVLTLIVPPAGKNEKSLYILTKEKEGGGFDFKHLEEEDRRRIKEKEILIWLPEGFRTFENSTTGVDGSKMYRLDFLLTKSFLR